MGGFVSHDGRRPLSLVEIEDLVSRDEIEYPIASEDEIKDRSKGDAVTKALVVFQTTWFLLQCAARGRRDLAITELELATAAFALLNVITYAIWWDKPLDVRCPIRVRRTHTAEASEGSIGGGSEWTVGSRLTNWKRKCWGWSWRDAVRAAVRPFRSMISDKTEDDTFFVVGERDDDWGPSSAYSAVFVTMVFGGIHCIAWSFDFPSRSEQRLWQLSSIAITGIPLVVACMGFVDENYHKIPWRIFALPLLLYVFSRVALLVLSLTTLRSLPPSAFQTVEWTTFLPHV